MTHAKLTSHQLTDSVFLTKSLKENIKLNSLCHCPNFCTCNASPLFIINGISFFLYLFLVKGGYQAQDIHTLFYSNIKCALYFHIKKNSNFPHGVIEKGSRGFQMIQIKHQYNCMMVLIGFTTVQVCLTASHPIYFPPPRMGMFH